MSDIPPLSVKVELELAQVKTQMEALEGQFKHLGETVKSQEGKFKELGEKAHKFLGKIGLAVGAVELVKVIGESTKLAGQEAQQQAELARQLKVSTGATAEQSKAINEQMDSMELASGISIDKLRPSFETLVRVTHNSTKAMALNKVAMDVAAATGKDVGSVSKAMAKAMEGNTAALQKMIPGTKGAKDQMLYLQKTFAGAAEKAADTNPYQKLSVIFEQLKKTLGAAFLPLIKTVGQVLQKLAPVIKIVFEQLGKVLQPLMPIVAKIIGLVGKLAQWLGGILMKILPPVIKVLNVLWPVFEKLLPPIMKLVDKLLPPLIRLLDKVLLPILMWFASILTDYVIPYVSKLAEVLGDILAPIIDGVTFAFQKLGEFLKPIWDGVIKPMLDGLMSLLGLKVEPEVKVKVKKEGSADALAAGDVAGLTPASGGASGAAGGSGAKTNPMVAYAQATQDKLLAAQKKYQDAVVKATQQYKDDVQKKVDDFKAAFASATAVNAGDLFSQGYQSADAMLNALKDKMNQTKNFAADAGKLASAGYSAEFIKQVMAQGPVMGDQMAQSLLASTPDQAKQIQDMFQQANEASTHGVDGLATSMTDQFTVSTKALGDALTKAAQMLKDTLSGLDKHLATKVKGMKGNLGSAATDVTKVKGALKTAEATANQQVINVTNNNNTNATAASIAQATINSIKFGLPITASGATG